MKLIILGSGGGIPTPKPFCECEVCKKARKLKEPYKRNNSSLFIEDINTLIDCGEDIADSLNREIIKNVDNVFITHWHPDHSFGLRVLLDTTFNFPENKTEKTINLYIPKKTYKTLKEKFPVINFLVDIRKQGKINVIEDGDVIKIGNFKITAVGYSGKNSDNYAYLIEEKSKKVLYAPCDTIGFIRENEFKNLDLLIHELGILLYEKCKSEISFPDFMKRLRIMNPKKTIATHIEEPDLRAFGWGYLEKMRKQYLDINFEYAYDGMKIKV